MAEGSADSDWRSQLTLEDRKKLVAKIVTVLKDCVTDQGNAQNDEARLNLLASKFEDNVFQNSANKNHYLHNIANKMYNLKTKAKPTKPGANVPLPGDPIAKLLPSGLTVANLGTIGAPVPLQTQTQLLQPQTQVQPPTTQPQVLQTQPLVQPQMQPLPAQTQGPQLQASAQQPTQNLLSGKQVLPMTGYIAQKVNSQGLPQSMPSALHGTSVQPHLLQSNGGLQSPPSASTLTQSNPMQQAVTVSPVSQQPTVNLIPQHSAIQLPITINPPSAIPHGPVLTNFSQPITQLTAAAGALPVPSVKTESTVESDAQYIEKWHHMKQYIRPLEQIYAHIERSLKAKGTQSPAPDKHENLDTFLTHHQQKLLVTPPDEQKSKSIEQLAAAEKQILSWIQQLSKAPKDIKRQPLVRPPGATAQPVSLVPLPLQQPQLQPQAQPQAPQPQLQPQLPQPSQSQLQAQKTLQHPSQVQTQPLQAQQVQAQQVQAQQAQAHSQPQILQQPQMQTQPATLSLAQPQMQTQTQLQLQSQPPLHSQPQPKSPLPPLPQSPQPPLQPQPQSPQIQIQPLPSPPQPQVIPQSFMATKTEEVSGMEPPALLVPLVNATDLDPLGSLLDVLSSTPTEMLKAVSIDTTLVLEKLGKISKGLEDALGIDLMKELSSSSLPEANDSVATPNCLPEARELEHHTEIEPDMKRARLKPDSKSSASHVVKSSLGKLKTELVQCASNNPLLSVTEPTHNIIVIEGALFATKKESFSNDMSLATKIIVNFEPIGAAFALDIRSFIPEVVIVGGSIPNFAPPWGATVCPPDIKDGNILLESFMSYITRWSVLSIEMETHKHQFSFVVAKSRSSLVIECRKTDCKVHLPAIYLFVPYNTSQPLAYSFGSEYANTDMAFFCKSFDHTISLTGFQTLSSLCAAWAVVENTIL